MPLSPKEYAELNQFKPLTPKEKKRGKEKLTISGTDEPMPWAIIYSKIRIGEPIDNIAEVYGHKRKITLWAIEDNIEYIPELGETLIEEVGQRKKMDAIERADPTLALTIKETANEYAPDATRKAVTLGVALMDEGLKMAKSGDCSTNDLKNLSDMLQKITDTLEITKRHSAGVNVNTNNVKVTGFDFVLDEPEAIEAEIEEKGEEQ